ncbi:hypothetical protein APHAL10511_006375 [Amanita phalloides]|nr:hypothetical protein APHAL10511_006375 [Amanita phalloides]
MSSPPFPKCASSDDAEQARRRLARKSFRRRLFPPRRSKPTPRTDASLPIVDEPATADIQPITLSDSIPVSDDDHQDKFAWAVLYENQRGLTLFSTRYYSHRSLLPMDPAPFTLPFTSFSRSMQSFMTLDDYQFSDGTWHWVSKSWMIDMRSDTGEIQHDGFEYNWFFRKHHWRAEVGPLSAGGWVRRRRWIRLMMRPAKHPPDDHIANALPSNGLINAANVWQGPTSEDNWSRCHAFMKRLDTDGRKLEVWLSWLRPLSMDGKGKQAAGNYEQIEKVLGRHMDQILELLVYPESQVRLLAAVRQTGMSVAAGRTVEFWR